MVRLATARWLMRPVQAWCSCGASSSSALLPAVTAFRRGLAKKPDAKKPGAAGSSVSDNSEGVVRGLNIFKDSPDEVQVKPDSEYPDWVFTLHLPRATYDELAAQHERDPTSLPMSDQKRMLKLWNRRRIKEWNESKRKK